MIFQKTPQKAEPEPEKQEEAGPSIDPVMQKYMEMVAAQKSREKEVGEAVLACFSWYQGGWSGSQVW